MGISIDFSVVLAYAFGLLLLYIVGWLLVMPLKFILRLLYNGIIGGLMLWILNLAGGFFNVQVAINPVTALIAGFLGIPGVLLILFSSIFCSRISLRDSGLKCRCFFAPKMPIYTIYMIWRIFNIQYIVFFHFYDLSIIRKKIRE